MRRLGLAGGLALALTAGLLTGSTGAASAATPPGWSSAAALTSGTAASGSPRVVIDAQGNETVAYLGGAAHRVYVTSRPAGVTSWSSPAPIAGSDGASGVDALVAGSSGDLTVVWRFHDGGTGNDLVEAAGKPAGGGWGATRQVSSSDNSATGPADAAVDDRGDVIVAWTATPATGSSLARAARWTAAGGWTAPVTLSDGTTDVTDVHVAADPAGDAMAVWTALGASQAIESNLFAPATGWLGSPDTVSATTGSPQAPQVTTVSGSTFAATWVRNDGSYDVVEASEYSGSWSPLPAPAQSGYNYQSPRIAADSAGDVALVFLIQGSGNWQAGTTTLSAGAWSSWDALSSDGYDAADPRIASDPAGEMVAVWTRSDGSNLRVGAARRPAGGAWAVDGNLSDTGADASGLQLASDAFGDVSAVWTRPDTGAVPQIEESHRASAAPVGIMTGPASLFFKKSRIRATWDGADWSGDTGAAAGYQYDVGLAIGAWNRTLGAYSPWAEGTTATSGHHGARPGHTYCFRTRALDAGSPQPVTGPWSTPMCTTTPVDDRTATVSPGWSRQRIKGFYRHTGTVTTWQGATMTLKGVKARHLALLVAKGPKNGKIWVFFGNQDLGTYGLSAHKNKKKVVIDLATFSQVKKGTLTIIALTAGKQIRIDGIFAAK